MTHGSCFHRKVGDPREEAINVLVSQVSDLLRKYIDPYIGLRLSASASSSFEGTHYYPSLV